MFGLRKTRQEMELPVHSILAWNVTMTYYESSNIDPDECRSSVLHCPWQKRILYQNVCE